jgi:phosphoglycolate phosphatase
MFQSLIFDLDGTLIESALDIAASVNHARGHFGLPPVTHEAVNAAIGDGVRVLLQKTLLADREVPMDEALAVYMEHQEGHCLDHTVAYPGVVEGLAKCSQFASLAIVSNKPTVLCVKILKGLGILQHFKACVGGDTPAGRKPSAGPMLRALESLQRPPWDALAVGDSPNDILAGAAAGMGTCAVSWGYRGMDILNKYSPDLVVRTFDELVGVCEPVSGRRNVYELFGRERFFDVARAFYGRVEKDARLRAMFPKSFEEPIEHQALFLMQFFGGPPEYNAKRGAPRLRMRHAPFPITTAAADAWLENMRGAVEECRLPEPGRGIFLRYVTHTARMLVNQ